MSQLPTVAIIGRPNTGKSTLFNRLVGERKAIVSEIPGTTRDTVAHRIETKPMDFLLLDTGGMGGGTQDKELEKDVHRQSLLALEHADLILLTIDSRTDLTSSDHEIVTILRKKSRRHVPVLLVLTKCDNPVATEETLPALHRLGIADQILPVSAAHNIGTEELVQSIIRHLKKLHFKKPKTSNQKPATDIPRIAVIGKPNVGKSSLINALLPEADKPLLVSDIPGTTRDRNDRMVCFQEQDYLFIDTAGLKRRSKTEEGIETFAMIRSIQALEECDIALLVISAEEPMSRQDLRLASLATDGGKGLIILLNKIDLLKGEERIQRTAQMERTLSFCRFATILPCSTVTRENLLKIFPLIETVQRNRTRHIPTSELNRWYRDTLQEHAQRSISKSKHITQADEIPPTFVVFVHDPRRVKATDLRYLENRLRAVYDFAGTPVRFITKATGQRT
ncbi:MAG: ribosome biogenesis GTPase Der [Candidatus Peribacteraceae bacterium]|nr:ribosome biogenesis GTPase Der [Candidatus Peribacteraceae bacterium]